ncbi:MAG: type II secretion system F family protein [Planctomycetota bacterium]
MNESLTTEESEAVLIALSHRIAANLPLNTALTALAEESTSPQAQRVLRDLDRRLQTGESPNSVIVRLQERLPAMVGKLLQGGMEIGRLDLVMQVMLNQKQWDRDFRHRLMIGFAYPTTIFVSFVAWVSAVLWVIVPQFKGIFDNFGIELPGITKLLIGMSDVVCGYGFWLVPALLAVVTGGWYWLLFGNFPRMSSRSGQTIPIIGPMLSLRQFSEFCEILAILVEGQLPLPKAVQFASAGLSDPTLQATCHNLVTLLEHGESIESAANRLELPHAFSLVLRQPPDEMASNLRALSNVYTTKGEFSIRSLIISVDVMVMMAVSVMIVTTLGGLFLPLIRLLNDLS